MKPQPMIAIQNVEASSRWYQSVLGMQSGHGGPEYEQLVHGGTMIMQLHHWDAHEHSHLGNQNFKPYGNGVVLWFQEDQIELAFERASFAGATALEPLRVNPLANHREFWLRDPDGYVVVVAGRYGDVSA